MYFCIFPLICKCEVKTISRLIEDQILWGLMTPGVEREEGGAARLTAASWPDSGENWILQSRAEGRGMKLISGLLRISATSQSPFLSTVKPTFFTFIPMPKPNL